MIDIDKYEGHTEGKREIQHNAFIHIEGRGLYATIAGGFTTADAALIADAPLLLAEIKRLRNDMAYCASLITCMVDMGAPLSLSVVREGMLDSIGMTVDEAMVTTDLMGDEQE